VSRNSDLLYNVNRICEDVTGHHVTTSIINPQRSNECCQGDETATCRHSKREEGSRILKFQQRISCVIKVLDW
jgi:hypothetical protein